MIDEEKFHCLKCFVHYDQDEQIGNWKNEPLDE